MNQLVTGIHHVTAITADAQKNINFYAGILGLRLIKKTVNFDAPEVYHLYFGDETGNPGTILTFFPYQGLVGGRQGKGMLNTVTFSVPTSSMGFWQDRLKRFQVDFKPARERFDGEAFLYFEDPDGLGLELLFNDADKRPGFSYGNIPLDQAIKGFYNVEIWEEGYERTAGLLTQQLDHRLIKERGNRFRYAATDSPGNYVDILCTPDSLKGLGGSGTVHHIAFCTQDENSQMLVRTKLKNLSMNVTPVLDRNYFKSIYFREPGGVLFEVATAGPGFAIDESVENLGELLKLPHEYESLRANLEKKLPVVSFDFMAFK